MNRWVRKYNIKECQKFLHPFPCAHESWGSLCLLHSILFFLTLCLLHWAERRTCIPWGALQYFIFLAWTMCVLVLYPGAALMAGLLSPSQDFLWHSPPPHLNTSQTSINSHLQHLRETRGYWLGVRITAYFGLEGTISPNPLPWDITLLMTSKGQREKRQQKKSLDSQRNRYYLIKLKHWFQLLQWPCSTSASHHQPTAATQVTRFKQGEFYLGQVKVRPIWIIKKTSTFYKSLACLASKHRRKRTNLIFGWHKNMMI